MKSELPPLYCMADEKTDGLNSTTSEAIFEAAAAESNEVFTTLWLKMDDSIQPTVARSAASMAISFSDRHSES